DDPENYVHRVGRTGRGTNRGIAVSFCGREEKEKLEEIESYLDNPIKVLELDPTDYEATIDFSKDAKYDWKSVVNELIDFEEKPKKKKKQQFLYNKQQSCGFTVAP